MANRAAPRFYLRLKRPGEATSVALPDEARVLSFRFEDTESKTDKLTLTVDNHNLAALDGDLFLVGNTLEFQFGYPGAMSPPREAVIMVVKGFNPLTVEADAKDGLMHRVEKTGRVWDGVKRSDVVREICRSYGYTDEQLQIEDTKLVVDHVTQAGMTDLQLIKSLAAREGFEFYVDFDGAHFHRRNTRQKATRTFIYFADPGVGDILSINMEVNGRAAKPGAVSVAGKNDKTGEPIQEKADNESTTGERTGLAGFATNFGAADTGEGGTVDTSSGRISVDYVPKELAQEVTAPTTEATAAAAQRAAVGAYLKQQLRGAEITISAVGDALVLAKTVITLLGAGSRLSGNWYVKSVTHELGDGYRMTMKCGREGLAGQGAPSAATVNREEGPAPPTDGESPAQPLSEQGDVDQFGNVTTTYGTGRGV